MKKFAVVKTKNGVLFTCPKIDNHKFDKHPATATFLADGTIVCIVCGYKKKLE